MATMAKEEERGRGSLRLPLPLLLLLLSLCLHFSPSLSAGGGAGAGGDDCSALAKLAATLTNLPSSWGSGDCCGSAGWRGVGCQGGSVVVAINLVRQGVGGSLPNPFPSLPSLRTLSLQGNQISGPLPSLAPLAALQELYLDNNAFSSLPAAFFSGLSALRNVTLDNNPLAPWPVPDDLELASGLISFSAANASISGAVPPFLGSMPNLLTLRLSYNNLTGSIPPSFRGSPIQSLLLNNQISADQLTGGIDAVGDMPSLQVLWLQSNAFSGPIPDVSNLTALAVFNVRDNSLTGPVPPSLLASPALQDVTLSNNLLQGPYPAFNQLNLALDVAKGNRFCNPTPGPCDPRVATLLEIAAGFGYPKVLASSWVGNNPCAGGWMGVVCDASGKDITVLNFAGQHFSGFISPAVANLTSLTKLVLSNNNLTGPIPDSLTSLSHLQLVDVTNNSITGKIPNFAPSVQLKTGGNPEIGVDVKPQGGGSSAGAPGSDGASQPAGNKSKSSAGVIVGIVTAVIVLTAAVVGLVYHLRNKKQRNEKLRPVKAGSRPYEPEMVKVGGTGAYANASGTSFGELQTQSMTDGTSVSHIVDAHGLHISIETLRQATNNFSEDNILGRGGFGVVYKGEYNSTMVAVKRNVTDHMGKKGQEEFKAEINVLQKVRHRHLVALLGYCDDGHERLLVYEYMPGGTLGQHLHEYEECGYSPLTWKQRLSIALDVARGIEYLHSLAQESFIHRDLKPSNILLDKDMRAKVSDFGLVKLAADNQKSMMTRLAGTFGYLAPEYAITGKVTTKIDVYAFGVILMEIITGRKSLDDKLPDEDAHLVVSFRRNILDKEKFMKSVDPILELDEEAHRGLMEVADLARHCTAREPFQRPDMSHCVNRLAPLVEQWKPGRSNYDDSFDDSSISLNEKLEKWQHDNSSRTELFSTYEESLDLTRRQNL